MSKDHDSNMDMADILIVDDESANLKLLSEILGREGYRVRPANSPRLAIDSALAAPPDLILLDIRMPEMDGFEACALLKQDERTRDIPILFVSALQDTKDKVQGFKAGGVDFITKPFQEGEVLARVRTHLKLRYMQRNLEKLVAERTAELSESEQLARSLLDATTDVTHLIDADGTILDLNDAMAKILGGTRKELIGTCIYDFFPTEVAEARREIVRQAFAEGKPIRQIDRQRPEKVYDVGIYPIETSAGEKGRVVIFAHDITERERFEHDLKKNRDYLEHLINSIPDAVFSVKLPERTIEWARDSYNVMGQDLDEYIGKTTDELYSGVDEYKAMGELLENAIRDNKDAFIAEALVRNKDGESIPVEINTTIYREKGEPVGAISLVRDISSRKRAQEALEKSEERLRSAQQIARLAYWEWDLAADQFIWSDEMYQIYGIDPGTPVTYDDLSARCHPDDRKYRQQLMDDLFDGKTVPPFSYRIIRPDGSVHYIYGVKMLERDDSGAPYRIKGTFQDVTDIRKVEMAYRESEAQLKEAQSETMNLRLEMAHLNRIMTMNELAASFAHEINQPLGAIVNNATTARMINEGYAEKRDDLDEILEDIAGDAQRAGQIISKIRGIMKKGDVVYTPVDVNRLLDEVIALYQNPFSLDHVTIAVKKDPDLFPVKADPVRLQQVLMNLITNAMDAMGNSPQKGLAFKTSQSEGMVKVSITDTGPGIEESAIHQIFNPFYTTKSEGMGIGLRLCKSIIEEHGGRIWAQNNRGGGTTFYFTLKAFSGGNGHELA